VSGDSERRSVFDRAGTSVVRKDTIRRADS
jgi:hypothetical protein